VFVLVFSGAPQAIYAWAATLVVSPHRTPISGAERK
jgi:hypothetical protein